MASFQASHVKFGQESQFNTKQSAFIEFIQNNNFWCLDALRCFSILAVIWHHSGGDSYSANNILFAGHHGVTLFFVISGFLITSLLIREKRRSGAISLSSFYMRRALRIFPLYYAVLLVYCALVFILERHSEAGRAFIENLIYFATYTSNYFVVLGGDRVIFYFAWSLAVEEQFYLIWPAIEKYLEEYAAALTAVLLIILVMLTNSPAFKESDLLIVFLIKHLAIPISLGVLLAHALHSERVFNCLYSICTAVGMVWLSIILPFAILYFSSIPDIIFYLSLVFLLCTLLLNEGHIIRNFLSITAFTKIGTVSYGLYLFHMLALNAVRKILPSTEFFHSLLAYQLTCFILASVLGYFIASLSYHYYEKPFLNLKKKWASDTLNANKRNQFELHQTQKTT